MNTAILEITNCLDCPFHKLEPDCSCSDGDSWSRETMTLCHHKSIGDKGKKVSGCNSWNEERKFSVVPDWCPIIKIKID